MAPHPDAQLAARVAADADADAVAELSRRFGPRIRLYGLRHLRDEAAADDLVQEVLILTINALRDGRVEQPEKLASFVLGCSRLVARNHSRSARRRQALLGAYAHEPRQESPATEAEDERLANCMARLGERARAVMVLSYYADRNSDEIAAELGMSSGNVRVVRHRAIASLFTCLEEGA